MIQQEFQVKNQFQFLIKLKIKYYKNITKILNFYYKNLKVLTMRQKS